MVKSDFKIYLLLMCLSACGAGIQAQQHVAAVPYPVEVIQADSTKLTIRLYGDEHAHYTTTTDGYVIMQNKKGYYCFTKLANQKVVPSRYVARNVGERSLCTRLYLKRISKNQHLRKHPK